MSIERNDEINIYNNDSKVFQVDSKIVKSAYANLDNYLIINDRGGIGDLCAIYFSGNSIYFPNTEEEFHKQIVKKNRFEWYGIRYPHASKHIFIRDIHKQWYLTGINSKINSPELLYEFLKKETENYRVVCIGSSAGGYAAILYGCLLKAIKIYAFSPQTELHSLEATSEAVNPIYFRLKNSNRNKYYELSDFVSISESPILYFCPILNEWDKNQYSFIHKSADDSCVKPIFFSTSKHGVPFPKVALDSLFLLNENEIGNFVNKKNNPIAFSIRLVGLRKTIKGIYLQLKKHFF